MHGLNREVRRRGAGWNPYGGTVNTANGTNSITISPPTGNLFFRLKQ